MYAGSSLTGNLRAAASPTETAGFRWQPDICPIAKAIVKTVRPKASETPSNPIPTFGKAAASTALPHPPRTSQNVPRNSAVHRFVSDMKFSFQKLLATREQKTCESIASLRLLFLPLGKKQNNSDDELSLRLDLIGR